MTDTAVQPDLFAAPPGVRPGRLEAIWIKRFRGGPMDAVPAATARAGRGLESNANQGGRRQVTLLEREEWERRVAGLDPAADPCLRRANLLVSGTRLAHSSGRTLCVGDVRIRIYAETKPCHHMDEALPGLRRALREDWGGGAFGEVLDDGEVRVGDPIVWVDEDAPKLPRDQRPCPQC